MKSVNTTMICSTVIYLNESQMTTIYVYEKKKNASSVGNAYMSE